MKRRLHGCRIPLPLQHRSFRSERDSHANYTIGYCGHRHCPGARGFCFLFGLVYLLLTLSNDLSAYRAAVAAGKPGLMNCALGAALVLSGTPIYVYYRWRKGR